MSSTRPAIFHLNPSPTLGGAEIYTQFLAQSLVRGGWENQIVVAQDARYWDALVTTGVELRRHDFRIRDGLAGLPDGSLICVHAPVPKGLLDQLAGRHRILGLAHQAVYSASIPYYYSAAHCLLPVSGYVADTLRGAGFSQVHPVPLLGVAALARGGSDSRIQRGPQVEWDRRKFRDRVLGWIEPWSLPWTGDMSFTRRPGLTLGIVSRLAPLKQFPELFRALMPVLQREPDINLEIFGSAIGYRQFRELRNVLRPLGGRVRFWGFQRDVAAVYPHLDYLLTGLPEREALGLNVIEAQQCGVPVLAPAAPPFTETVIDGRGGYLYADPRKDSGAGFADALIRARARRPDPREDAEHLAQFSEAAFDARIRAVFEGESALAAAAPTVAPLATDGTPA
jgi:glycosyltransferase involved in cell wall biosynthesis